MKIINCQQRSCEWLQARIGNVTASRVSDVMAKLKRSKEEAADRRNYRAEKVVEILTGRSAEHYVTPYMEDGADNEPLAVAAYEMAQNVDIQPIGFVLHETIARFGASPDGFVGKDGLVEVKCLRSANHLDILKTQEIPPEFQLQMLAEMAVCEKAWCDFVSYDPRMPEHLQLFVKRMARDEARIAEVEGEVETFLLEVAAELLRLTPDGDLTPVLEASLQEAQSR